MDTVGALPQWWVSYLAWSECPCWCSPSLLSALAVAFALAVSSACCLLHAQYHSRRLPVPAITSAHQACYESSDGVRHLSCLKWPEGSAQSPHRGIPMCCVQQVEYQSIEGTTPGRFPCACRIRASTCQQGEGSSQLV
eukprot:6492689-Amphidinium_carterae.1